MPFQIVRQDITKMPVDAIVNAANTQLLGGGGVCGAIFQAAGAYKMEKACEKLSLIATGEAVLTSGFALPCRFVIHAAGPIYSYQSPIQSRRLLQSTYFSALTIAAKQNCKSIAFPLISSGIYGYPKAEALQIASETIQNFLLTHEMDVFLTVFDREAFSASQSLLGAVKAYIDQHYVDEHTLLRCEASLIPAPAFIAPKHTTMDQMLSALDKPFGLVLLDLIDKKGKTDVEVYKRANIDRKLFSKIRTGKGYVPRKRTVIALSLALELTLAETDDLLQCAGYALSHSQRFDVIIEYFILHGQYDLFAINEVLFQYDLPLLGA